VAHSWQPLLAQQQRQLSEETLAAWVTFGHWISGLDIPPSEVRFQHPAPADTGEHLRIFRCPVLFGQADNALVFPKRLLSTPLGQADAQVRLMLDAYAERLLGEIQQGHSMLDRARLELIRQLPEAGAELGLIAARLAISPRTLQRRLREAGLSFNRLVDETRQQLVLRYLRDPALELAEIAFLVGFSEPGSLARAFRRWTGQSPGEYRRQLP
jgi:AraC-like DNA-binding protein